MSASSCAISHSARCTLVIVNTGDGKGKSTAAFGVVVRAAEDVAGVAQERLLVAG